VNAPAYEIPATAALATALKTGVCPPYSTTLFNSISGTVPTGCPNNTSAPVYPYYAVPNANSTAATDTANASAVWHPITTEWLGLGFARGLTPPTAPGTNPITPNAILLLQEPADRSAAGAWPFPAAQIDGVAPGSPGTIGTSPNKKLMTWNGTVPLVTADLAAT